MNIVLASDSDYLPFAYVTIYSVLGSREKNYHIDFYIMVPQNTEKVEYNKNWRFSDYEIHYMKISDTYFSDITLSIKHITRPTYYRLLIPELFKKIERCIYLDGDVLVCGDLWELYNSDLTNIYLMAGLGVNINYSKEKEKKLAEYLQIPSAKEYFNAGVLVMNLTEMRSDNMVDVFLECSKKKWICQDQDVLNKCCYGKAQIVPFKYNVYSYAYGCERYILEARFSQNEIKEGLENPFIIHYAAGQTKPWCNLKAAMVQKWWQVAQKALTQKTYSRLYQLAKEQTLLQIIPDLVPKIDLYNKIVIFGCGKAGKDLFSFIEKRQNGKVIEFWDNNPKLAGTTYKKIPIKQPEEKKDNCILIVISCQRGVSEIKNQLFGLEYENDAIAIYSEHILVSWFGTDNQYKMEVVNSLHRKIPSTL